MGWIFYSIIILKYNTAHILPKMRVSDAFSGSLPRRLYKYINNTQNPRKTFMVFDFCETEKIK